MPPRVLFLALKVFSATGGIEKVSRLAGKALWELCGQGSRFSLHAVYDNDSQVMEKYFPGTVFRGFGGNRVRFTVGSIRAGRGADWVVLSHINLLSVGYAIKMVSPKTKLALIAHGIEVWQALPAWKLAMLRACDLVLPVSRFTRDKMREIYGLDENKLVVVNNCLDPFLPEPVRGEKSARLLQKYGLQQGARIVLTVNRLSYNERYKGYDEVMMAIKTLKREEPLIRYLIVGKYDAMEKARLDRLIRQQGLQNEVVFAGFVPDEDLAEHFNLADVYAMPSRKEGFGIVFIEALYYGLPVIAGNIDGSVDALADGELGYLVDPDWPTEILAALKKILQSKTNPASRQGEVMARFGFDVYKNVLAQLMGFATEKINAAERKDQPCSQLEELQEL
ncbi:glycosyltransferase family 4 protein [Flavisolibacter nicotianae]|uniref:glycosyltransferase family 4 protein n=1 Tax=Flavisolibacter nicotianae TaxID=2364882 RepID=UPI000EAD141A|nr:glycosyltransferase family 4 protein [Flavisolibacter nicotianae]